MRTLLRSAALVKLRRPECPSLPPGPRSDTSCPHGGPWEKPSSDAPSVGENSEDRPSHSSASTPVSRATSGSAYASSASSGIACCRSSSRRRSASTCAPGYAFDVLVGCHQHQQQVSWRGGSARGGAGDAQASDRWSARPEPEPEPRRADTEHAVPVPHRRRRRPHQGADPRRRPATA